MHIKKEETSEYCWDEYNLRGSIIMQKRLINFFFPLKVPENIISVKRRNESSLKVQQLKVQKAKTKHPWALLLISWLFPDWFDTNRQQKLWNKHK